MWFSSCFLGLMARANLLNFAISVVVSYSGCYFKIECFRSGCTCNSFHPDIK